MEVDVHFSIAQTIARASFLVCMGVSSFHMARELDLHTRQLVFHLCLLFSAVSLLYYPLEISLAEFVAHAVKSSVSFVCGKGGDIMALVSADDTLNKDWACGVVDG